MFDWLKRLIFKFLPKRKLNMEKVVRFKCGHCSPRKVVVRVLGKEELVQLINTGPDWKNLCPQCLADIAIPCGICGKPIMPYQYVGCTTPTDSRGKPRKKVEGARYRDEWVVICTNCCEFGTTDAIGAWKPPGVVDTEELPWLKEENTDKKSKHR